MTEITNRMRVNHDYFGQTSEEGWLKLDKSGNSLKSGSLGKLSAHRPDLDPDPPNIFSFALNVLMEFSLVLQLCARSQFSDIKAQAKQSHDTQSMANRVDEIIYQASLGNAKTRKKLPDDVINYMDKNNITIDGQSITDYLKKNGPTLDKGQLQAVKAALDNSATRSTDIVNQGQLIIQSLSQKINAVITEMTGLLSKWGELSVMIAQKTFS